MSFLPDKIVLFYSMFLFFRVFVRMGACARVCVSVWGGCRLAGGLNELRYMSFQNKIMPLLNV